MAKKNLVVEELKEHWPLALVASLVAAGLVILISLFGGDANGTIGNLFEIFHPAHILVSAAATSAIYFKYKKSKINGIVIGIIGAILIGSLSDVFLPWIAGNIFSLQTTFHLPIIENPLSILAIGVIGALAGIYLGFFRLNHSLHVFLSVFASLFYILAFSVAINVWTVLAISIIVFFVVYIPCCISDIVFPLLFIKKK
jgi:hypothetical protein